MGLGQIHKQDFNIKLTCTTKQRGQLVQIGSKWCGELNRDKFKFKFYIVRNLWEEVLLPLLVIYYVTFHGSYIEMTLFSKTSKWEFQNWDSYCFKTLDAHIFFKL